MAMYWEKFTVTVKSADELFTLTDYKTLIRMIESRDIKTTPLSKAIKTKDYGLCRYEFHLMQTENKDIWEDIYIVSWDMSRNGQNEGCCCPYNLKELQNKSYEEIKERIFKYFGIEDIPPENKQISLFDF